MRLLAFLMPGAAVLNEARTLLSSLGSCGDVVVVQPWCDDYFPEGQLPRNSVYVALADRPFPAVPRLPREDYEAITGRTLDLVSLNSHGFLLNRFPTGRGDLFEDSWHYQQLNMLAYRFEQALRQARPDVVVLQGGSDILQQVVRLLSGDHRVPVIGWETPFLPGRLLLDPVGMHYFPGRNRIDRDWPRVSSTALEGEDEARLDGWIADWRGRRVSKYAQGSQGDGERRIASLKAEGKKIAFFPGQIGCDASIVTGPRGVWAYDAYIQEVARALPPGWTLVYKHHPLDPAPIQLAREAGRVEVVRGISIHDLFAAADTVLVHSSNVGFEALIAGKPVVCLGTPHYAGKGLTLDVERVDDLAGALGSSTQFHPDEAILRRFLHYVAFDYLLDPSDRAAIERRLNEGAIPHDGPSSWSDSYPEATARFHDLARVYNDRMRTNAAHHGVVAGMASDPRFRPFLSDHSRALADADSSALEGGRRQVAAAPDGYRGDTRMRYALAAELARPGWHVVDFGCGTGHGSSLLARVTGVTVTGVDASEPALDYARRHWMSPNLRYATSDAAAWAEAGCYDMAVAFETLEQMADAKELVGRLWEALKPGGLLLVSSFNRENYGVRDNPYHVRHLSPGGAVDLLAALPGAADVRVLAQDVNGPIFDGPAACFLVGLAVRRGPGSHETRSWVAERLRALLPFTATPGWLR
jgi:2-polyprenyl-3-methyl-5-hydroxy-6-metoxy-1,4-benzoquinol methylase